MIQLTAVMSLSLITTVQLLEVTSIWFANIRDIPNDIEILLIIFLGFRNKYKECK